MAGKFVTLVLQAKPLTSGVTQYVTASGPATRVAGSNPLDLVSALLSN